jgi:hypothetical protein
MDADAIHMDLNENQQGPFEIFLGPCDLEPGPWRF